MDSIYTRWQPPKLGLTALALLLASCVPSPAGLAIDPLQAPTRQAPPRVEATRGLPDPWTATPTYDPATPTTEPSPTPSPTPRSRFEGPFAIGTSVAGRPLEVYRFGNGPSQRLILAGIHGGYEWNTIALADELISYLRQNLEVVPPGVTLYILRAFNPDGAARSRSYEGRANENGVDLNRNWPFDWARTWPPAGCWSYLPINGGTGPASEPETRALLRFLLGEHIEALISYHSAALGIFPGGHPPHPGSLRLAEAIAEVTDYPYPPIETGCTYTGQLADWAAQNGIAAVDVELSTHYSLDLEQNLRVLQVFLNFQPWGTPTQE